MEPLKLSSSFDSYFQQQSALTKQNRSVAQATMSKPLMPMTQELVEEQKIRVAAHDCETRCPQRFIYDHFRDLNILSKKLRRCHWQNELDLGHLGKKDWKCWTDHCSPLFWEGYTVKRKFTPDEFTYLWNHCLIYLSLENLIICRYEGPRDDFIFQDTLRPNIGLKHVTLKHCYNVDAENAAFLLSKCTQIESLCIKSTCINPLRLGIAWPKLYSLKKLTIYYQDSFGCLMTEEEANSFLSKFTQLEELAWPDFYEKYQSLTFPKTLKQKIAIMDSGVGF